MGRHSIDYVPDDSIAPPGGPESPNGPSVPGGPDPVPGDPEPTFPEPSPDAPPASPEITPSEPPPFAPDEAGDGSVPPPVWHSAGEKVL